ncbi:MAG: Gfo/Idh/MocA family oxidoreductase [Planctomycetota bacterium]|nr:Gfo/Idh/MocA family oxidoreductase [Planctomycetota bacterium]MDA1139133.1 Gfo/Idh/MocA family oxidoreductase [Planctomycetota bacterium]
MAKKSGKTSNRNASVKKPGKLRAVQVGCGGRAQTHMDSMIGSKAVDLVAICDIDEVKLKAAGERFQIDRLYTSMEEMIQKEEPEFVDICTPPTIRTSIVGPAIAAGAPAILIEKPIALKPSESRKLVEWGEDRLIAVNTQYQWMPHWQKFWPMLRKGQLGEIRSIRCSTRANILEQGPHTLDLALTAARVSGLPEPEWVVAGARGLVHFGDIPVPADTNAIAGLGEARLQFTHGPSAPIVPGEERGYAHIQVEVIGSKGRIWVSLAGGWTLWLNGKFSKGKTGWPKNDGEAQRAMYVHLRDAIHGGKEKEFPTRVELAARNSDLMMACYVSALTNERVDLPAKLSDSIIKRLNKLGKK